MSQAIRVADGEVRKGDVVFDVRTKTFKALVIWSDQEDRSHGSIQCSFEGNQSPDCYRMRSELYKERLNAMRARQVQLTASVDRATKQIEKFNWEYMRIGKLILQEQAAQLEKSGVQLKKSGDK